MKGDLINLKEISYYLAVGVFATTVDWLTFSAAIRGLNFPYQFALILALTFGGLAHYSANKIVTFKCHSRQYGSQIPLYIVLAIFTLCCSMGVMALLLKWFALDKLWARMLTTGVMIYPNYLLHKHLTFNKKIFS